MQCRIILTCAAFVITTAGVPWLLLLKQDKIQHVSQADVVLCVFEA